MYDQDYSENTAYAILLHLQVHPQIEAHSFRCEINSQIGLFFIRDFLIIPILGTVWSPGKREI